MTVEYTVGYHVCVFAYVSDSCKVNGTKHIGLCNRAVVYILESEEYIRTRVFKGACLATDIQRSLKNRDLSVGVLNIIVCTYVNALAILNGKKEGVVTATYIGAGCPIIPLVGMSFDKPVLTRKLIALGTEGIAVIGIGKIRGMYRNGTLADSKSTVGVADSVVRAYVDAVSVRYGGDEGILYLGCRTDACPIAKRHGLAQDKLALGNARLLLGMNFAVVYGRI